MPSPRYTMTLAKEDFKFSVAHFTVFSPETAELLHGHNYRVRLELAGGSLDDHGLLADLAVVKRVIRRLCAELDGRVLVPGESSLVGVARRSDGELEITFAERRYRLPEADTLVLPLANTSIELLAGLLWERLVAELPEGHRIETVTVSVEETAGQASSYRRDLAGSYTG